MAMMGHAEISTTMIYVHHVPQHDAADKLGKLVETTSSANVVTDELRGLSVDELEDLAQAPAAAAHSDLVEPHGLQNPWLHVLVGQGPVRMSRKRAPSRAPTQRQLAAN